MIDRKPLERSNNSDRKAQTTAIGSLSGSPGRRRLASCGEPSHDRRSEAGIRGIPAPRRAKYGTDDGSGIDSHGSSGAPPQLSWMKWARAPSRRRCHSLKSLTATAAVTVVAAVVVITAVVAVVIATVAVTVAVIVVTVIVVAAAATPVAVPEVITTAAAVAAAATPVAAPEVITAAAAVTAAAALVAAPEVIRHWWCSAFRQRQTSRSRSQWTLRVRTHLRRFARPGYGNNKVRCCSAS